VSPIFRHGRLRLYLLKLLDEAPRHGYEVIRLLQDRFMGVYSPSPGTIYPRLARLEDDGLVTHDDVDGRKVYRITEKGREEIRARLDDLAELEDELTESVRDIAREVGEDVRDTVRSLREEITWAARDIRRDGRGPRDGRPGTGERDGEPGRGGSKAGADALDAAAAAGRDEAGPGGTARDGAGPDGAAGSDPAGEPPADDARRIREEARQARDDIRDAFRSHRGGAPKGGGRAGTRAGAGAGAGGRPGGGRPDWAGFAGRGGWAGMPAGLDRLASDFARDLSHVAGHAGDLGEGALGDLKNILADALTRIRDEVFAPGPDEGQQPAAGDASAGATAHDGAAPGHAKPGGDAAASDAAAGDATAGRPKAGPAKAGDAGAGDVWAASADTISDGAAPDAAGPREDGRPGAAGA
jgi:DNA-binding PadR family transcriptional regulator